MGPKVIEDSRRQFLIQSMTGVSAAWLAASWPEIAAAAETSWGQYTGAWTRFAFFTQAQGATVDAMAAQIFPTTDTPGAKEAQAIIFIDTALVTFAKDQQAVVTAGLDDLSRRVTAQGGRNFESLTTAQQITLLTAIQTTPFFRAIRDLTVMGMFAAPQHGGNFNKVGWKLIGFDDSLNFHTPFGSYDV
ncbi:MAG: gluconate 2-dehydrogenase subunit 3 family protein [Alphaproteobacteria bacterium]|nr:gluconate 2-dehydrogenase subunit 3 family protein [Alphaproteobacteria bacterium]